MVKGDGGGDYFTVSIFKYDSPGNGSLWEFEGHCSSL
jgi:hypothetical protein